ncbi:MAG TPA: glycosyl hydrolase, partial [Gemmatimonadaceae bacterium]|nr:glycosyl hydrolase [Gemmatimonadaceae bacterium]
EQFTRVVREDPVRRGLLYAGTERGVWVSFDDGARWQSLSLNLPDVQVPDLVVEERDLVIATHGRSMWLLENIEPLRQIGPGVERAALHLYRPRPAVRRVYDAVFQYRLAAPADTVKVEVLDSAGAVIRTFVGARKDSTRRDSARTAPARAASRVAGCDVRSQTPPTPPVAAGLNQFTWDGRYPGAATFECMVIWSARPENGPLAPPGRYQVRVTAIDARSGTRETRTQPFTLRRDPRIRATDADLAAQFALARQVSVRTSAANEAVIRIRALRDSIDARLAASGSGDGVRAAGDSLRRALSAVEEELYQVRNRSGQDPLNFPIKLNNRLAALQRSVETGDGRPTAGAYKVFRELSAELDRHLARLKEIEQGVRARFGGM